jgi:hypothetical protein
MQLRLPKCEATELILLSARHLLQRRADRLELLYGQIGIALAVAARLEEERRVEQRLQ